MSRALQGGHHIFFEKYERKAREASIHDGTLSEAPEDLQKMFQEIKDLEERISGEDLGGMVQRREEWRSGGRESYSYCWRWDTPRIRKKSRDH